MRGAFSLVGGTKHRQLARQEGGVARFFRLFDVLTLQHPSPEREDPLQEPGVLHPRQWTPGDPHGHLAPGQPFRKPGFRGK